MDEAISSLTDRRYSANEIEAAAAEKLSADEAAKAAMRRARQDERAAQKAREAITPHSKWARLGGILAVGHDRV